MRLLPYRNLFRHFSLFCRMLYASQDQIHSEKRMWHSSRIYQPSVPEDTLPENDMDLDDLFDKGLSTDLFATEPKQAWTARSSYHEPIAHVLISGAWNEEEARALAQQRRKEQRDAAWARKKLERSVIDSAHP